MEHRICTQCLEDKKKSLYYGNNPICRKCILSATAANRPANKICTKCLIEKDIDSFFDKRGECKKCFNDMTKTRNILNSLAETKFCVGCSQEKSTQEFTVGRKICKPCYNHSIKLKNRQNKLDIYEKISVGDPIRELLLTDDPYKIFIDCAIERADISLNKSLSITTIYPFFKKWVINYKLEELKISPTELKSILIQEDKLGAQNSARAWSNINFKISFLQKYST